jgi:transcription antitermination protein NusB
MGTRRISREFALQALFYVDARQDASERALKLFCDNFPRVEENKDFILKLVNGVIENQPQIDGIIERFSSNWKVHRMGCVDRNVLRIAVYELLHCPDIPHKVAINEAIDIGKKFGTDESGAFVNGILDSIRIAMEKGEVRISEAGNP